MTAKEPRPASHFRLVLQGVEANSSAPLAGFSAGELVFPVIGAQPEVRGFDAKLQAPEPGEQSLVDRVSDKLQALYDGLPDDERPVLEAIMSQAAAYGWDHSG